MKTLPVDFDIDDKINRYDGRTDSYRTGIVYAIYIDSGGVVYLCYDEAGNAVFRFTDKELDNVTLISEGSDLL